jgi:hypothetical protein
MTRERNTNITTFLQSRAFQDLLCAHLLDPKEGFFDIDTKKVIKEVFANPNKTSPTEVIENLASKNSSYRTYQLLGTLIDLEDN